ncbi:MAG: NAD-dependent epimerase/dehydratase family protein [candidate division NC10 bacterium]|nr:NAD-dependent epimerase/dehydratase family protein [candidate division NC10 bacterium]
MKVLITGGAGFLGSHLTDALLARGDEVTILDVVSDLKVRHNLGNPHFHYVRDSVLHADILESLILKCDLIYHLAAVVGVEHYVGDPYEVLNVNINGTQAVLKLAYKYNRKVVFSSTSEVYGRNPKVPFAEDDERVLGSTRIDRWCYSTSKAAAEHFCFAYHRLGLPMVVLRYFNVYGPRLDKIDVGRVITIFMGQVLRGEPVTVIGDGKQTRCFTYIDDAIRATVEAGTNERSVGEIFKIAGSRSKVVFVPQESVYGDSYEDVPRRVPRVQRMHEILKVRAETPLEKGLRQTIEWFKAGNGR